MKRIIIKIIKLYQRLPINTHSNCRFIPSCSQYMIDSINEYGTFKGILLGFKRILRCNPLGSKGYDPVIKKGEIDYEKNN